MKDVTTAHRSDQSVVCVLTKSLGAIALSALRRLRCPILFYDYPAQSLGANRRYFGSNRTGFRDICVNGNRRAVTVAAAQVREA